MTQLGVAITAATVAILVAEWLRVRTRPLPVYGWLGLMALAGAEWLMFRGVEPVATYFTPLAWTAYILLADAAVFAVRGHSRLRDDPREFAKTAVLSIPLWLIFEAYNLRLANWDYIGLPENWLARYFGYAWSFATITPGIFVTADLIESLGWPGPKEKEFTAEAAEGHPSQSDRQEINTEGTETQRAQGKSGTAADQVPALLSRNAETAMLAGGALCLVVPLVLPQEIGAYLFAPVWLGFIFLLDPVNARLGQPSFITDFAQSRRGRFYSLLLSGWVCGWLWEFWNYWAAAKWVYIFPIFQEWKIFEMPVPGFLGFLPFALECFTMYVFASWVVSRAWKKWIQTTDEHG